MVARNADICPTQDLGHAPNPLIQDILIIIKKLDAFQLPQMPGTMKQPEPEDISPNNERNSHD